MSDSFLNPQFLATGILIVSYIILFTEKLNRAVVALLGASAMIFCGVLSQESAIAGIDFNTISLLIGMMVIVGIAEKSGMFEYAAIYAAKLVKASPRGMLAALALITAVFSALLDNVTTVLLIVPVTFQITHSLKLNPYPFLILEIFASNIGGTATLIGDPPNILIGSALNLSFMDFVYELTPVVLMNMLLLILIFDFFFGRKMRASAADKKKIMSLNETESITDKSLFVKSLIVLAIVIAGFVLAEHIHLQKSGGIIQHGGLDDDFLFLRFVCDCLRVGRNRGFTSARTKIHRHHRRQHQKSDFRGFMGFGHCFDRH